MRTRPSARIVTACVALAAFQAGAQSPDGGLVITKEMLGGLFKVEPDLEVVVQPEQRLPPARLQWKALNARLESMPALEAQAIRALAAAADGGCVEPARDLANLHAHAASTKQRARQLVGTATSQLAIEQVELELAFYSESLPNTARALAQCTQQPGGRHREIDLEFADNEAERSRHGELACFRLQHTVSDCRQDADCTMVQAGCSGVALNTEAVAAIGALSNECVAMCPMVIQNTVEGSVCERGRCRVKQYPGWMSGIDVCFARERERGRTPSPLTMDLVVGEQGRVVDAVAHTPALGATPLGRCLAARMKTSVLPGHSPGPLTLTLPERTKPPPTPAAPLQMKLTPPPPTPHTVKVAPTKDLGD